MREEGKEMIAYVCVSISVCVCEEVFLSDAVSEVKINRHPQKL